jgi:acetyl/propionyl-CoA carboxylase alpha subunit
VRTSRGVWVGWPGGAKFFGPERTEAAAEGAEAAEIRAPMTGRVVKVEAEPGRPVQADDLLVILQAMKMEYRLTAPCAGVVESVRCAEGQMVDLGATLVTLAPAPEPAHRQPAAGASAGPAPSEPARTRPRRRVRP